MTTLLVNGQSHDVQLPADMPLLWALRDVLHMTGTKFCCDIAQRGACTVHLDGEPARPCLLPLGAVQGRAVITIEAVGATPNGQRIQAAWLGHEVDAAMSGNICRCATYGRIRAAIHAAAAV